MTPDTTERPSKSVRVHASFPRQDWRLLRELRAHLERVHDRSYSETEAVVYAVQHLSHVLGLVVTQN